jgi:PKD repeat protein
LWGRLADLFSPRFDAKAATSLALSPRRLEARRMLDAAAPALALATLEASSEFVQAGEDYAALNAAADVPLAAAADEPPIDFLPTTAIDEDGVATLEFFYDVPGATFIEIDWGDGSGVETFAASPGSNFFGTTHQYFDDDPTLTVSDDMPVHVRILSDGDPVEGDTTIEVNNVAPTNVVVTATDSILEDGVAQLEVTFHDPGTLDSHQIEVDWGDGNVETFNLTVGARFLGTTHQYLDDDPSVTTFDDYTVTVRVIDDDTGESSNTETVRVTNVAPSNIQIAPMAPIDEHGVAQLELSFDDPGSPDVHQVEVDWGDGQVETFNLSVGERFFSTTHQYLDDDPTGTPQDLYQVKVRVLDDDGGVGTAETSVEVRDVAPLDVAVAPLASIIAEGSAANLTVTFDDPGTLDTHTFEVDWGDGHVTAGAVAAGMHTFAASHTYADNGNYNVTVRVTDDDTKVGEGTTQIEVTNVPPTLAPIADKSIAEGSLLSLPSVGQFTDPGFDNPLNPVPGGELVETFTYVIDWGDGTADSAGNATVDVVGSPGVPTSGSFDGSPTFADNGSYLVTVTVTDDDGDSAVQTFTVTVSNVAPTLAPIADKAVAEGSLLSLPNIGQFTDPGFDNPLNPVPGGELVETFTYVIDWGDGTADSAGNATVDVVGSPGVPTSGSFDGSHTYADNGSYLVTVTVTDDDGDSAAQTFTVTVSNVAPTLDPIADTTIAEGALLSIPDIGQFTDPGFDNPLNPIPGGELVEAFTYVIDWGDGTADSAGAATVDLVGSPGVLTSGSFDSSHTFADNGSYLVTVTVTDDDGDSAVQTFTVTVSNVAPTLAPIADKAVAEGSLLSLPNVGQFTDPGFDNPLNPIPGGELVETFTYVIDWGDGTADNAGAATVDLVGSPGVLTSGSFDSSHTFADNGTYLVTVTVTDDDGGSAVQTFTVAVSNVAPTLTLTVDSSLIAPIDEGETVTINFTGLFSDPGFDNPLNPVPGGELEESFEYDIDWGDGLKTPRMALADANAPLGPSTGVINQEFSHQYVDNDLDGVKDAKYTITVTVYDDDGGSHAQTFEIIVYNVNPTLEPITATSVNNKGETTLTLTFDDPGAPVVETFEILIDWGDKLGEPDPLERFVVELDYDGTTPETFQFLHTYSGPPNPLNPAADIVITVKIRDDDFGTATSRPESRANPADASLDGQSNLESVAITNPGIGGLPFRIDTTPQIALLTLPERTVNAGVVTTTNVVAVDSTTDEISGSAGESRAASERFLELRIIEPDGTISRRFRLPPQVLDNLPALFRNLPDNHYAIFLVQPETDVDRLVLEVYVRNGKLIDPGDDTEGGRDAPPTDEAPAVQRAIEAIEAPPERNAAGAVEEPTTDAEPLGMLPSSSRIRYRESLASAAIALCATSAWRRHVEQTLAKAKPQDWKKLRTAGHRRRRKPR